MAEIDVAPFSGSVSRSSAQRCARGPAREKAGLVASFLERFGDALREGRIRPSSLMFCRSSASRCASKDGFLREHFGRSSCGGYKK